jgi:hypothetical protein
MRLSSTFSAIACGVALTACAAKGDIVSFSPVDIRWDGACCEQSLLEQYSRPTVLYHHDCFPRNNYNARNQQELVVNKANLTIPSGVCVSASPRAVDVPQPTEVADVCRRPGSCSFLRSPTTWTSRHTAYMQPLREPAYAIALPRFAW